MTAKIGAQGTQCSSLVVLKKANPESLSKMLHEMKSSNFFGRAGKKSFKTQGETGLQHGREPRPALALLPRLQPRPRGPPGGQTVALAWQDEGERCINPGSPPLLSADRQGAPLRKAISRKWQCLLVGHPVVPSTLSALSPVLSPPFFSRGRGWAPKSISFPFQCPLPRPPSVLFSLEMA